MYYMYINFNTLTICMYLCQKAVSGLLFTISKFQTTMYTIHYHFELVSVSKTHNKHMMQSFI